MGNQGHSGLRSVNWRQVLARQDYANVLMTVCLIIATAVVSAVAEPHTRQYFVYDATISYAPKGDYVNTIPSWVAVFVPLVCLAITVVVGELVVTRHEHKSATDAVATAVHFFADGVQSFVCGLLLTQVFKVTSGRLRPDFLARCKPQIPSNISLMYPTDADPQPDPSALYPCTQDGSTLTDGRKAFPSGHASASANLAVYASAYLIWCYHWRKAWQPRVLSFRQELLADMGNVLAKAWCLAMVCFSWGVAVSRTVDNQHAFSDVLGGLLLGYTIAIIYVLRAIPRYKRVLSPDLPTGWEPEGIALGARAASRKDGGAIALNELPVASRV